MLSCHEVSERADDYLDHNLSWWTHTNVRMHLFLCDRCQRYIAQLKLVVKTLRLVGRRDESAG